MAGRINFRALRGEEAVVCVGLAISLMERGGSESELPSIDLSNSMAVVITTAGEDLHHYYEVT